MADYNLPKVQNGQVAGYLTPSGWNNAMDSIATALDNVAEGVSGAKHSAGVTYCGVVSANETTASVTITGITADDNVTVNQSFDSMPTNITVDAEAGTVTVTWATAPTKEESFTVYVYKNI